MTRRATLCFAFCLLLRGMTIWTIALVLVSQPAEYFAAITCTMCLHFAWRCSKHFPTPYPRRNKGVQQ